MDLALAHMWINIAKSTAIVMLLGSLLLACEPAAKGKQRTGDVLDLRGLNDSQLDRISLDGPWRFYHQRFLHDPRQPDLENQSGLLHLSGSWNGQRVAGEPVPVDSCGTYVLKVILPDSYFHEPTPLVLELGEVGSASSVFVNGKLLGQRGRPDCNPVHEIPNTRTARYVFQPTAPVLHIYIQVSNANYWKGGIWHPIYLGRAQWMFYKGFINQGLKVGLLAVLLVMGIYHLSFALFRKSAIGPFFFGLVCMLVSFRLSIIGQKYLLYILPSLTWIWQIRLEYISLVFSLTVFAFYLYYLFPTLFPRQLLQLMSGIGGFYILFLLLTSTRIFTQTMIFFQIYMIAYSIYATVKVGWGVYRGRAGAFSVLVGGVILILTVVNDILMTNETIESIQLGELGMMVFIFSNAMVIARRAAQTLLAKELLSGELKKKNRSLNQLNQELLDLKDNLEVQVRQRTIQLEGALDRAETATRAKSMFLANMSHEIRTPLNAIMGFTELLEDTGLNDAQYREVDQVQRSSHHLLEIVNDILDFSRIEAGHLKIKVEPGNLIELLQSIIISLRQQAERQHNQFDLVVDDRIPETLVYDSLRLNQILMNLVNNAHKFTESGKVQVHVRILAERDSIFSIRFKVEDTGIGIAREQQKQIFESFGQVDSDLNRTYGGTGLGLSIARMLLALMNSELNLKSEIGEGSCFWFDLEMSRSNKSLLREKIKKTINALPGMPEMRVLLVDDNEDNRMLAARFLRKWGIVFSESVDGRDALDCFESGKFDIILMDLQMPNMDGYESTRQIRKFDQDIIIIAMTAAALNEVREEALAAGMNEFLTKPFRSADLHAMLYKFYTG